VSVVHDSHATTAELLGDPVVRDGLPDHLAEILGLWGRQVNDDPEVGDNLVE